MAKLGVGVVGCAGRMGRLLLAAAAADSGCRLVGGTERPGSDALGLDLGTLAGVGALRIQVSEDPGPLFEKAEVVLDFTTPEATRRHARLATATGTALVVGTTGLGEVELAALESAAEKAAVVRAANMSLGVNLLQALVEQTAARLSEDYDIEILEMHHRHKVDAPSGTALALGEAAAAGRRVALEEVSVRVRDGVTGPRRAGDIGFAVLRGGDVAGEHSVVFAGLGERLELAHRATDRAVFARGAIKAALWTRGRPPGLYGMRDVLGL